MSKIGKIIKNQEVICMTLEEALKKVHYKKRAYFRWKFGLKFQESNKEFHSEEEFLEHMKLKSILPFQRWERTNEYRKLVALYLQGKYGNDLIEIYDAVVEKAKKGDGKAVDTLLKLQKEIKQIAKTNNTEEIDAGDDLELR